MVKCSPIRSDSAAHIAILRLVELGGTALLKELQAVMTPRYRTDHIFRSGVVNVLVDAGLARMHDRYRLEATSAGKNYAGEFLAAPPVEKYVPQIVPGRQPGPRRELNLSRHRAAAPFRVGAEEYRDIPSLMGGQRVAYKGSSN